MVWDYFALTGALVWLMILLLPWRPWDTREYLDSPPSSPETDLSDITVLIPARNESQIIGTTLSSLSVQGHDLTVILVDDQSGDETVAVAKATGMKNLQVVCGESPPERWNGKLWALEQGFRLVHTPLTLLLDADISLEPGMVAALRKKLRENSVHLVSLMAHLRMSGFWERLLMPAFVYFFKMLYPFRLSNSNFTGVAAAAGGCILLESRIIREMGGFNAIHHELIDDCALAKQAKLLGCRTWIGLTHSVRSLRSYHHLADIRDMVARTGFCQLRYSVLLLIGTTVLMMLVFWVPVAGLFFPTVFAKSLSAGAVGALTLSYLPTLRFYGVPRRWALALPLIASFYLFMTWSSAIRFWFGEGSAWKGRLYKGV